MIHDEVTLDKESDRACADHDHDQKWIKGDPKSLKNGSKVDDGLAMAGGEGGCGESDRIMYRQYHRYSSRQCPQIIAITRMMRTEMNALKLKRNCNAVSESHNTQGSFFARAFRSSLRNNLIFITSH